jgi:hypothetical protein
MSHFEPCKDVTMPKNFRSSTVPVPYDFIEQKYIVPVPYLNKKTAQILKLQSSIDNY